MPAFKKKNNHINTAKYHVTGDSTIKFKIEFEGELDFNKDLMDPHYEDVSWAEDALTYDKGVITSVKGLILKIASQEVFNSVRIFDKANIASCTIKNSEIENNFKNFLKEFNSLNNQKKNEELLAAKKEAKLLAAKIAAMEASSK